MITFYRHPNKPTVTFAELDGQWFAIPITMTTPEVNWGQRIPVLPQEVADLEPLGTGGLYVRMLTGAVAAVTEGERFRAMREARGLSQQEVADGLGKSLRTISGWERGERRVDAEAMRWLERLG